MQEVQVPVVSDADAAKKYGSYNASVMNAASGNSKDTCQGDSGGPLFAHNGRAYVVVGVTSYGKGCGAPGTNERCLLGCATKRGWCQVGIKEEYSLSYPLFLLIFHLHNATSLCGRC